MKTPQIAPQDVRLILSTNGCDLTKACMLSIRGYYLDSMGSPGKNDRRIYDDCTVIYHPTRGILAYQSNTDPNGYREGHGAGESKGMATLKPGKWKYGTGLHKGRLGFRQCAEVTVVRDGNPPETHTGWFAIDIHDGGVISTSSLGCQTLPPLTFKEMRSLFYAWLVECDNPKMKNDRDELVHSFDYVLIEETERRKGNLLAPR